MKYRTFGRTGWQVSEIGFGAWAIGADWGHVSEAQTPWPPCMPPSTRASTSSTLPTFTAMGAASS